MTIKGGKIYPFVYDKEKSVDKNKQIQEVLQDAEKECNSVEHNSYGQSGHAKICEWQPDVPVAMAEVHMAAVAGEGSIPQQTTDIICKDKTPQPSWTGVRIRILMCCRSGFVVLLESPCECMHVSICRRAFYQLPPRRSACPHPRAKSR